MYSNPFLPQLQNMQAQLAQMQQPQQACQIQYVKGLNGAKSFVMPPTSSAILMDSDMPVFYAKFVDANGVEQIKEFEFKEKTATSQTTDTYALKSDFDKLSERVAVLAELLKNRGEQS